MKDCLYCCARVGNAKMSVPSVRQSGREPRRMQMYGLNHKAAQEEAIVRRREIARIKNEYWHSTANYFDRLQNQNQRFTFWTSDEAVKKSEEAFRKAKLAETRRANLLSRRNKLRTKLEAEEVEDLDKIRKIPLGISAQKSLRDVRQEYEKMKLQRMEEQQKEAEEKMLQHWRINNPEYREVISRHFEL